MKKIKCGGVLVVILLAAFTVGVRETKAVYIEGPEETGSYGVTLIHTSNTNIETSPDKLYSHSTTFTRYTSGVIQMSDTRKEPGKTCTQLYLTDVQGILISYYNSCPSVPPAPSPVGSRFTPGFPYENDRKGALTYTALDIHGEPKGSTYTFNRDSPIFFRLYAPDYNIYKVTFIVDASDLSYLKETHGIPDNDEMHNIFCGSIMVAGVRATPGCTVTVEMSRTEDKMITPIAPSSFYSYHIIPVSIERTTRLAPPVTSPSPSSSPRASRTQLDFSLANVFKSIKSFLFID